jgi:outer membrane lipoprotein-sorting protein
MRLFLLSLACLFALFPLPARAQQDGGGSAQAAVAQAESYLRGLHTVQSRFVQTAQDGRQLTGTFYLNRPGKLRFEYDAPVTDFIVADGIFIYFYDGEMGEQSNAPIGQTLADFLLRENLRLGGGEIRVTDAHRAGGLLQITLTQKSDPGAGSLTLYFTENPMALKKWRVLDSTGASVQIELFQMQTGVKLADNLFVYVPPKSGRPSYNN